MRELVEAMQRIGGPQGVGSGGAGTIQGGGEQVQPMEG